LLDRQLAAAYCGVSVNHFLAHVPVPSLQIGEKRLWDRQRIDEWLDADHRGSILPSTEDLLKLVP
jgi:hypothetical protein